MSFQVVVPSSVLLCLAVALTSCGDDSTSPEGEPERFTTWHDQGLGIKQSEGDLVYGRKTGPWTWWHPNGQVAVRGEFMIIEGNGSTSSEEVGKWEEWHPNGQKKSSRDWLDGRADGLFVEWHDNGKVAREATYAGGRAEGDSRTFHPSGGVSVESQYSGGRLDGPYRAFWPTGEKKISGNWEAGIQVGAWRAWHPNGQVQSEEPFESGVLSGAVKTWYASGAPESETLWVSGGVVSGKQWYESRDLRQAGASRDGLLEAWYEGGQIKMRGELSSGERTGPWHFFHFDGAPDLEMTGIYEAGERIGSL